MSEFVDLGVKSPFSEAVGVRLVRAAAGESEVEVDLAPQLLNTWGVAHGGVTMTLLDIALSSAARTQAAEGTGLVTVEMKVNFMRPGSGKLHAFGHVMHRSTTMAFCEGEVRDSNGAFVAKALGSFKYMKRLPVGREIAVQTPQPAKHTVEAC